MDILSIPTTEHLQKGINFFTTTTVGKQVQVDLATKNKTRPSCSRVKVEVDLQREFPKRINVGVRMQTWDIMEKLVQIMYDHVQKYRKNNRIQGHHDE